MWVRHQVVLEQRPTLESQMRVFIETGEPASRIVMEQIWSCPICHLWWQYDTTNLIPSKGHQVLDGF